MDQLKITLQVGDQIIVAGYETLLQSKVLRDMILKAPEQEQFFLDGDPDVFVHVLEYLVNKVFPLLHDKRNGHDYAMYAKLQQSARLHGLDDLYDYLDTQSYHRAIKISRIVDAIEGSMHFQTTSGSHIDVQYVPQWTISRSYVCPRRIAVHMGNRDACGKDCMKKQGSDPVEFEDIAELKMVRIQEVVEFDACVLFPKLPTQPATPLLT